MLSNMHQQTILLILLLIGPFCLSFAQSHSKRINGPVIEEFGQTYLIDQPDYPVDTQMIYKVVFDIHSAPTDPALINSSINTLARFLNMHVAAGVPRENLHIAGVVHNRASTSVLENPFYQQKYGVGNPNIPLIEALSEAGVSIYMCGQSVHARGLERDQLLEPVQLGLSAMTIILSLQQQGYQLIKF